MTKIDVPERCGHFLSSRRAARLLREELLGLVASDGTVQVSFDGVESISNSFADSFLGVLVVEHGWQWLARHVQIDGLDPDGWADLEAVVAARTQRRAGGSEVSAVA